MGLNQNSAIVSFISKNESSSSETRLYMMGVETGLNMVFNNLELLEEKLEYDIKELEHEVKKLDLQEHYK